MAAWDFDRAAYGARVAIARSRKGFTQADLAFRIEWPASQVSHHETGKRSPSAANLLALCNVLDVSADWLLGRSKE